MKSKFLGLVLFIGVISIIGLQSCKKSDELTDEQTKSQIEDNIREGVWKITKFSDSGKDEVYHFESYDISFGSSGVLTASSSANTYEGTWSITDSKSNDDSPDDLHFNIYFNLANEFEDLNDDWEIVSQATSKIELTDVSGGNGDVDYLTFEKK